MPLVRLMLFNFIKTVFHVEQRVLDHLRFRRRCCATKTIASSVLSTRVKLLHLSSYPQHDKTTLFGFKTGLAMSAFYVLPRGTLRTPFLTFCFSLFHMI